MRLKRSRLKTIYLKKREVKKDGEGGTYEEYGVALPFCGETWPASGKVQAQQYGERLAYIYNVRIDGAYTTCIGEDGLIHYQYPNGLDVCEKDGICLTVPETSQPDYRIISIKPYRYLRLEVEKI